MNAQTIINIVFTAFIVLLVVAQWMSENKEEELEEEIKRLKDELSALQHKPQVRPSELDAVEQTTLENKKLIKQLLEQLGKKIKLTGASEQTVHYWNHSETYKTYDYEVVDLTDEEKRAKELREEADRLERGEE